MTPTISPYFLIPFTIYMLLFLVFYVLQSETYFKHDFLKFKNFNCENYALY